MKKTFAQYLILVSLLNTFASKSHAESTGQKNDTDCLLPANLKEKGFKCDSVGDFGPAFIHRPEINKRPNEHTRDYFIQNFLNAPPPRKEHALNAKDSVGKEITVAGRFSQLGKVAPFLKSDQIDQSIYLIDSKEMFAEGTQVEVTGKLQYAPGAASPSESRAGSPAYYFIDCKQAKLHLIK